MPQSAPNSGAKLRSGTTVEHIWRTLRERIIDGTYAPGHRMSQAQLAAELDVSRTPLREALQRLEADGLVIAQANRGMHVAPVVNSETEQTYAMRILVEPPTVAAVLNEITETDITEMRALLTAMSDHRGHHRRFQKVHQEFHDVALKHYPSSFRELARSLHSMIYRHQSVYLSHQRTPDDFIAADKTLLDAVSAKNPIAARRTLEVHLIDAALGLVLDGDPEHEFSSLLVALRGRGIEIDHDERGRISRPARVRWVEDTDPAAPEVATTNIVCVPD